MTFDDVFPTNSVTAELSAQVNSPVKVVPFMDCKPNTTYYVSRNGQAVFVGITFGEYTKVKKIKIYPTNYLNRHNPPSFRKTNIKNSQSFITIPRAVYGAFVLKDRMPKVMIR